jgi:hypothetical protein
MLQVSCNSRRGVRPGHLPVVCGPDNSRWCAALTYASGVRPGQLPVVCRERCLADSVKRCAGFCRKVADGTRSAGCRTDDCFPEGQFDVSVCSLNAEEGICCKICSEGLGFDRCDV